MAWRLAKSLTTLRDQINQAYPNRSKASDGTIGDPAHASRPSDHNPNAQGVVCALDLTHDPAHGFDAHALAETQRQNPHPNLKYIVSNKRIASRKYGWVWRSYTGSNPHSKHVHFSVGVGSDGQSKQPYDDRTAWDIGLGVKPKPIEVVTLKTTKVIKKTITIDNDGRGYVEVPTGLSNPLLLSVSPNGRYPAKEGYVDQYIGRPVWAGQTRGTSVVAECSGAKPNSAFDIRIVVGE